MPGVDLSSKGVNEIVLNEECVPRVNKVDGEIESDLQVTVQPKEPLEGAINRVVEGNRVKTVVPSTPKEKLVIIRGDVNGLPQTRRPLARLPTASTEANKLRICATVWEVNSQIKGTKSVPASDLAAYEEVFLSQIGSALSNTRSPSSKGIYSDLSCLIDTDSVEI